MRAAAIFLARSRPILTWAGMILLALSVGACTSGSSVLQDLGFEKPGTAVSYEVTLEGDLPTEVKDLAEASLSSYRLQSEGAPSLAFLRRRADSDVPVLLKILRSRGYYAASAEARIEETGPDAARIVLTAEPGPAYTLIEHRLLVTGASGAEPPELDAGALGSPVGGQAQAAEIATAEAAAVTKLKNSGFPYARFTGRKGLADPEAATLQVDSEIDAGPAFTFGAVRFEGVETIDEDYLLSYRPWEPGDTFSTAKLREFQRSLVGTGLFRAARLQPPETPPDNAPAGAAGPAPLPVLATVEEAPPRSVTVGLRYDTDLGPTVRATFEHRNLFGANERLLIEAEGGLVEQHLGAGLRKPQFLRPGQDLVTDLTFAHVTGEAYSSLGTTGTIGLERKLTERWTAGLGGLAEWTRIDDNGETGTATLLGAPGFAAYDSTKNLLDPVDGMRLRLDATPFFGMFSGGDTEFLVLDGTGSVYLPLDSEAAYVLAARGRAASILSPDLESIPATRRLYSGGGGSVRGYADNFVGPLDANNNPVGGRSALEAGVEMRARLFGDIGGAVFAEAGSVSTQVFPDFAEGVQAAAGLGLRYHSLAGPIRVDLAFPVNGRKADDPWQLYFSIGQAF